MDADEIILEQITKGCLIPHLTQFGETPPVGTNVVPQQKLTLLIERLYDQNPHSDPDHDYSLERI